MSHTPGPWRPNKRFTTILDSAGDERMCGIAEIRGWVGRETQEANARLISVAPDGLKLAQRVVEYFGEEDIPDNLECDIELRNMARELIAKAAGKS